MTDLVFTPPDADSPGFLRRQKMALKLNAGLHNNPTEELLDELAHFLCRWVTEPEDKDEAYEALVDASENQFDELLGAILGRHKKDGDENPTKSPPKKKRAT